MWKVSQRITLFCNCCNAGAGTHPFRIKDAGGWKLPGQMGLSYSAVMNPSVKCRSFPGRKAYDILLAYMNKVQLASSLKASTMLRNQFDQHKPFIYVPRVGSRAKGTLC